MSEIDVRGASSSARYFKGAQLSTDMAPGLWEGRQFRAFHKLSASVQLRFQAVTPIVLQSQAVLASSGLITLSVYTGSADGGGWAEISANDQNVSKNRLPGNTYVRQSGLQSGGTFTGGTEVEYLLANGGNGQGNLSQNILGQPRLLPAGLYYFSFTLSGTSPSGVYSVEWEEL